MFFCSFRSCSGFSDFYGYDINPLAILISKARYTKLNIKKLFNYTEAVEEAVYYEEEGISPPTVTNIHFWFSKRAIKDLSVLRKEIFG